MRIHPLVRKTTLALFTASLIGGAALTPALANESGNHFGVTYAIDRDQPTVVAQSTAAPTMSDARTGAQAPSVLQNDRDRDHDSATALHDEEIGM